jgi:hypothetical protein
MNKEQQRIKIAEARGFTVVSDGITHCLTPCDFGGMYTPEGKLLKKTPDYLNDLNAMHEAEKMLTKEQLYNYGNELDRITLPKTSMEMCYIESPEAGMYPDLFCATAAQRAEAFLKTLKLWTNEA